MILAAGASSRMGQPKALLQGNDGRTMLRAWLDAIAPICPTRLVVTGAHTLPPGLLGPGERAVHNPDWARTGPVESLALALRAEPTARHALVSPVDTPPPAPADLARLVATPPPACLGFAGRPGHPVWLGDAELGRLRAGPPPAGGLRALLAQAAVVEARDERALWDWDDPAAWARYLRSLD